MYWDPSGGLYGQAAGLKLAGRPGWLDDPRYKQPGFKVGSRNFFGHAALAGASRHTLALLPATPHPQQPGAVPRLLTTCLQCAPVSCWPALRAVAIRCYRRPGPAVLARCDSLCQASCHCVLQAGLPPAGSARFEGPAHPSPCLPTPGLPRTSPRPIPSVAVSPLHAFQVLHIPDFDFRSSCLLLSECLSEIKAWSGEAVGSLAGLQGCGCLGPACAVWRSRCALGQPVKPVQRV